MWFKVLQGELPNLEPWSWLEYEDQHIGLHEQANSYLPGIHLININLVANWEPESGRTIASVQEQAKETSNILAQLEVLSIYGVLTTLFMEQDGENLPYTDMPGTILTMTDSVMPLVMYLLWGSDRQALTGAYYVHDRLDEHAAPVLKELPS